MPKSKYSPSSEEADTRTTAERVGEKRAGNTPVSLAGLLSKKSEFFSFKFWIVGQTPLICHAWSEKARREMLGKQLKAVKGGKEVRDPHQDFVSSLYEMGDGSYGFPAMGVKNCLLSAAHKDRGIARSTTMSAIWIDAELVRTRPALSSAICDMPLLRIFGSAPENREDMVKIGSGLNKIANLAYRAQFTRWAMRVTGRINTSLMTAEQLAFLVEESGVSSGLGEWRNERRGLFGAFSMATADEENEWEQFARGEGPLPQSNVDGYASIAAE
jgi:hypothetical protein